MEEKSITGKGKAGWDIMENTNRVTGFEGKKPRYLWRKMEGLWSSALLR